MDFVQFSERNLSIADAVGKMADEIGATAAQVALSWIG
jgi:aryl-alcohol dehydrogenase-like predicted oxidoreductase